MSDYYLGQIMLVGFNFAPRGFALCNGQLLPIAQNTALFSLLGTSYGGNGQVTFQLPDLRGRTPVGAGSSADGSWQPAPYPLGQTFGSENVALTNAQLPAHAHQANATNAAGTLRDPNNSLYGKATQNIYAGANSGLTALNSAQLQNTGGSQPHPNMQPFNVLNFNICISGIYPSRN
jgi:microcystin-dependent protein